MRIREAWVRGSDVADRLRASGALKSDSQPFSKIILRDPVRRPRHDAVIGQYEDTVIGVNAADAG